MQQDIVRKRSSYFKDKGRLERVNDELHVFSTQVPVCHQLPLFILKGPPPRVPRSKHVAQPKLLPLTERLPERVSTAPQEIIKYPSRKKVLQGVMTETDEQKVKDLHLNSILAKENEMIRRLQRPNFCSPTNQNKTIAKQLISPAKLSFKSMLKEYAYQKCPIFDKQMLSLMLATVILRNIQRDGADRKRLLLFDLSTFSYLTIDNLLLNQNALYQQQSPTKPPFKIVLSKCMKELALRKQKQTRVFYAVVVEGEALRFEALIAAADKFVDSSLAMLKLFYRWLQRRTTQQFRERRVKFLLKQQFIVEVAIDKLEY